MNATLSRFDYPRSLIHEYRHWVVMIRPGQITLGCSIIAAKSACTSLAELSPAEAAELPQVIGDFERTIRRIAPAQKFNYLALMMVDPNPHFHAIPRYSAAVHAAGIAFTDVAYPRAPDLRCALELTAGQLGSIRSLLAEHWQVLPQA